MTITNDERREVAARLRKKHGERQGTFEPQGMEMQACSRLEDLLECLPKRRDMFLDLADLIEPEPERMCYSDNEPEFLYGDKWHGFRCSECGNQVNLCHNRKPNYCPNCGAKVLKD